MKQEKLVYVKGERSVFRFIMLPLLGLLALEIVMLVGGFYCSRVITQLRHNSDQMLVQQVETRRNYLANCMTSTWMDLSSLQTYLNDTAVRMEKEGMLRFDQMEPGGTGTGSQAFLTEITPTLISTLYAKRATGIFVILNSKDLSSYPKQSRLSFLGICIRDMDPLAPQCENYADLLLSRAPVSAVRKLKLCTASGWEPLYRFAPGDSRDFLTQPFQMAYTMKKEIAAKYCGYWSSQPYTLGNSDESCISYSQPLMLKDGTVYGVIGVELQLDYLRSLLPADELFEYDAGSYILAVGNGQRYTPVLTSGFLAGQMNKEFTMTPENVNHTFKNQGESYTAAVNPLHLYSNNAPFSEQNWVLMGAVATDDLYHFSNEVQVILYAICFATFVFGIIGSIFISRSLADPIRVLAEQVAVARLNKNGVPDLPATGIKEIDQFSGAIVSLSRSAMESSTRFLRIIDMASAELAGFEHREGKEEIFVTDNFFPLLGITDVDLNGMTRQRFEHQIQRLKPFLISESSDNNSWLYRICSENGNTRFLRIVIRREGNCVAGLAEDVTAATLERMRIEHERDYDLLTGIYNRRAFYRMVEELFKKPEKLGVAALLMIDLDNLKGINDRFGHDLGDQYIRCAGQGFLNAAPPGTLVARLSGDEFYLFFYGYEKRDDIHRKITEFVDLIRQKSIMLPNGKNQYLSISGGVAWYPDDSNDFNYLMKYADFAMYQVKRSAKNNVAEFDIKRYHQESNSTQSRKELRQVIKKELVTYYFQPIAETKSGKIRGYEALMRINMPTLKTPSQFLELARKEDCLDEVERLTWFKAAEAFQTLLEKKAVSKDVYLFINSMANQCITTEDSAEFHDRFSNLQPRIVMEIMEADHLDRNCIRAKTEAPGFSGMVALDDYGSGYNGEKNLLELAPAFTKLDISIVRNIDSSKDKQELVSNIVAYAHQRDMQVVAEGIETPLELETVMQLNVDFVQGYFIGRPAANPLTEIVPDAQKVISLSIGQAI